MMDLTTDHYDILLHKQVTETHIRTLNKYFSTLQTHGEGLQFLKLMLIHCPEDFIYENVQWLDNCLVTDSEHFIEVKCFIIKKFVEASVNNPELSKKLASQYLSKILEFCLADKKNVNEIIASFNVLTVCMIKYSNWFSHHKVKVEEHILSFLDGSDCINKNASIAFLHLQQVGNAGTNAMAYKNNFKMSVEKLCLNVCQLFDVLMENRIEIDKIDKSRREESTIKILLDSANKTLQLTVTRIVNVITFLMTMIQNDFITSKEIAPYQILSMIRRGTTIHKCVSISHENSLEDYQFCFFLNNIQVKLMHLLRILILWLQNNVYCFSALVNNILIDCLKRSQDCKCFSINCIYPETIYIVLKSWLVAIKSGLNSHVQTELITCILKDITPIRSSVTLNIEQGSSKKQRAECKIYQNQQAANVICESKYVLERKELQCQLALETLSTLFSYNVLKVDKEIIREVQLLTMEIFNEINTSTIPHPYKSLKSQLKLQELLVSFYEQDTSNTLPFISLSLNILNTSTSDNIQMESNNRGLNKLELLCQPVSPPAKIFSSQSSNDQQIIDTNSEIIEIDAQNRDINVTRVESIGDLLNYNRYITNKINNIEDPVNRTIDGNTVEQDTFKPTLYTSICESMNSSIGLNNDKKLVLSSQSSNDQQVIHTSSEIDAQNTATETQILSTDTQNTNINVIRGYIGDLLNYNRSVTNEINKIEDPVTKTIDGNIVEQNTLKPTLSTSICESKSSCIGLNNIKGNNDKTQVVINDTNNVSNTEIMNIPELEDVLNSFETVKVHNEVDDRQTNILTKISEKCTGDDLEEVNTNIEDAGFDELNSFVDELKKLN